MKNISDDKVAKNLQTRIDHQHHLYVDFDKLESVKLKRETQTHLDLTLNDLVNSKLVGFKKIDRTESDLKVEDRIKNSKAVIKNGKAKSEIEKDKNAKNKEKRCLNLKIVN